MAITTAISKQLENGFVQVDSTQKNGYKRFYKVPQKNADTFASELKKQDKNLNILSNISFFSSVFAGVIAASFFLKKAQGMKRFLIQTASGISLGVLSSLGFGKYAENEEQKLLNGYKAKEIFYRA